MVVTFVLGFVAAWRHDSGSKDASTLNRMVLQYAVPLVQFAGTVMTSRAALSRGIRLVFTLCIAIIGFYRVVFLFSRLVPHMQLSSSALAALTPSAPAAPFVGPIVLGDLFRGLSAIPIAIVSLVINLTVVPITIPLPAVDSTGRDSQNESSVLQAETDSSSTPK
jgi:malonate transporter